VTSVFIGIDVACAKQKRLPICFARPMDSRLEPLGLPKGVAQLVPRGPGNIEVRRSAPFAELAASTVAAIKAVCIEMGWSIARIAIDAPAASAQTGKRRCENELIAAGLSIFKTPSDDEWSHALAKCRAYLDGGGTLAHLPDANRIWMLYGFELFSALRSAGFDVIEIYPFAIVHALLPVHPHKSTAKGYGLQLDVIAERTGWTSSALEARLRGAVAGTRHDRLDAFMAAWVASLPPIARRAYGNAQNEDDAIWVPVN